MEFHYDWKAPHIQKHWDKVRSDIYIRQNGFIQKPQEPLVSVEVTNDLEFDLKIFKQKRDYQLKEYANKLEIYNQRIEKFKFYLESKSDRRADTASKTVGT